MNRRKILKDIKKINKEHFIALRAMSEEEMSNEHLMQIYEEISGQNSLYSNVGGDGINDAYMGEGIYVRPDGSTYSE